MHRNKTNNVNFFFMLFSFSEEGRNLGWVPQLEMFKNPYTPTFFVIIWNFDFPQEKYGLNIAACYLVLHL
jgi:hypothetical protein